VQRIESVPRTSLVEDTDKRLASTPCVDDLTICKHCISASARVRIMEAEEHPSPFAQMTHQTW